jgi:hypothetical protein
LVGAALAVGLFAATTVTPPMEVPDVALRATAVYRLEVGGAVFLGFYVAAMALTLALHNRGFTEFGSGGFKARDISAVSDEARSADVAMELLADLREEMDDLQMRPEGDQNA